MGEQISLLDEQLDALIQGAPVMMQVVDQDFDIVEVNERWIREMGYDKADVLGRNWTEFLTEESKARVVASVLPHCVQFGSARSVGVELVRKDNSVLQRLLDADADTTLGGDGFRYSAIFDSREHHQWAQAAITLSAIRELIRIRDGLRRGVVIPMSMGLDKRAARPEQTKEPRARVDNTQLTNKEREVLAYLATGAANGDIAKHFSLSLNTVKFHVENIFQKLGVSNRTHAVIVARKRGLLRD